MNKGGTVYYCSIVEMDLGSGVQGKRLLRPRESGEKRVGRKFDSAFLSPSAPPIFPPFFSPPRVYGSQG